MSLDAALRDELRSALRAELPAVLENLLERVRPSTPKLATREECAQFLNISTRSLDALRAKGLPTLWVLDSPRFELDRVLGWLNERGAQ